MNLVQINWQPATRQLRQFGIISLFALPGIGWIWGSSPTGIAVLSVSGALLATIGMAFPSALKPLFLALTLAATPIGIVTGELAMLCIYFGLFMPLGLIFRMYRRDALERGLAPNEQSYWVKKKQPRNTASYYRQS